MAWKDVWKSFASGAAKKGAETMGERLSAAVDRLSRRLDRSLDRALRRLFATGMQLVFAAIGAAFVLVAVVLFLSRFFTLEGSLLIVGLISVLVALLFGIRR